MYSVLCSSHTITNIRCQTEISLETHVANTKGITDTNSDAVNVFSLCDTYDDEGYGEMDEDEVRNKAFYNAVNALGMSL